MYYFRNMDTCPSDILNVVGLILNAKDWQSFVLTCKKIYISQTQKTILRKKVEIMEKKYVGIFKFAWLKNYVPIPFARRRMHEFLSNMNKRLSRAQCWYGDVDQQWRKETLKLFPSKYLELSQKQFIRFCKYENDYRYGFRGITTILVDIDSLDNRMQSILKYWSSDMNLLICSKTLPYTFDICSFETYGVSFVYCSYSLCMDELDRIPPCPYWKFCRKGNLFYKKRITNNE